MSCSAANSTSLLSSPPPPPGSPPLDPGTQGTWLAIGVILCILAVGLLALGTNVQRYGLAVVEPQGLRCGRISRGTAVWAGGWVIYVCGNGVYTFAVTLAPATLCSALLGTVVVWNGLIARLLLGERLVECDYHGGVLILSGIGLAQAFGPEDSVEHTAPEFVALFGSPAGQAYTACIFLALPTLAFLILWHERLAHRHDAVQQAGAGRMIEVELWSQVSPHEQRRPGQLPSSALAAKPPAPAPPPPSSEPPPEVFVEQQRAKAAAREAAAPITVGMAEGWAGAADAAQRDADAAQTQPPPPKQQQPAPAPRAGMRAQSRCGQLRLVGVPFM